MLIAIDPVYVLSGFLVGFLVGQTGVGGGSLMTPLLVLLFHIAPGTAVGTDLLYAAVTKTVGTLVHGLHQTVEWRVVVRLASGSTPATLLTLLLLSRTGLADREGGAIASVLGIMLLLTAVSLVFRRQFLAFAGPYLEGTTPKWTAGLTVVLGAALGCLVTISSVGAGALGVTALLLLYPRLPIAVIVGSDIAHAVPLTLVAGLGHWWLGSVNWLLLRSLLCGSLPGIVLGSHIATRVPDAVLRLTLAAVLTIVGARLLF
ncbi:MAG: sulfite exporter TauE/SafE family protein [Rhodopila sp.]